jgi:alkylation response protein AidB-like acyl-CoA dehydrogenase
MRIANINALRRRSPPRGPVPVAYLPDSDAGRPGAIPQLRNLTRQLPGEPPGPEGSILKLMGSELGVRISDAAGELLGVHALVNEGSELVPDAPRWFNRVLAARQYTIAAGTSEIQRNIIGERVLGLPKG